MNKLEQPVPKEAHSHKTMLESALPSAILFETVSSTLFICFPLVQAQAFLLTTRGLNQPYEFKGVLACPPFF